MTELENLYQQKFVLECKDRWTVQDWADMNQLNKRILELDPPKPKKQTWFEVRQVMKDGITEFKCRDFGSKEAAEKWIAGQPKFCKYYVKEL